MTNLTNGEKFLLRKRTKKDYFKFLDSDWFLVLTTLAFAAVIFWGYLTFSQPETAQAMEKHDEVFYCAHLDEYMMTDEDEPLIREYCLTK